MKRYKVYRWLDEQPKYKTITAENSSQALTCYIHYDIGYVPDVLNIDKGNAKMDVFDWATVTVNSVTYHASVAKRV